MIHSEQINELATALATAQYKMKSAKKDSKNPFFKSDYADLASVVEACREQLAGQGLAVIQAPRITDDGRVSVETLLVHQSGQWVKDDLSVMPKDDGPQAIGSCITYLRRYALAAMVGVAPGDDDAESGEGRLGGKTASMPLELADLPPGYAQWLVSYEAVVPAGAVALRAAFQKAKIAYREFLVKHDRERHEALKAAAALQPSDKGAA